MARPLLAIAAVLGIAPDTYAQAPASSGSPSGTSAQEIAEELSNPLGAQISVQFQHDLEWRGGPADDGFRYTTTLQPLVPIALDDRWSLVSRSSLPFVHQTDLIAADPRQTGLATGTESLFLKPNRTPHGLTWGVGPIVGFPATSNPLGNSAIQLGPTAAISDAIGPMTYGLLAHQLWSLGDRAYELALQPEIAWSGETGTTVRVTSETSYTGQWTIPVIATVAQIVHVANLPFELALGPIVYLDRPDDAPRWGVRASITLVIPQSL